VAETIDKGKPLRESLSGDVPLAIDHFRYFAGCIRAQEGSVSEIDSDTVAYHFHEPLGVVGQKARACALFDAVPRRRSETCDESGTAARTTEHWR